MLATKVNNMMPNFNAVLEQQYNANKIKFMIQLQKAAFVLIIIIELTEYAKYVLMDNIMTIN